MNAVLAWIFISSAILGLLSVAAFVATVMRDLSDHRHHHV